MASIYAGLSSLIAGLGLLVGYIWPRAFVWDDIDVDNSEYYESHRPDYYTRRSEARVPSILAQLPYQVPSLVFLLCLVVITARLAWSIRQIENSQPDIAVLPPAKMVTLHAVDNMSVVQSIAVSDTADVDVEKTKTELQTEQNV